MKVKDHSKEFKNLVEMLLEVDQEADILIDCREMNVLVHEEDDPRYWMDDGTKVVHLTT